MPWPFFVGKAEKKSSTSLGELIDLEQIVPERVTWVIGERSSINRVLEHTELLEIHVWEIIRSDIGFWFEPEHAACLTFPYSNDWLRSRLVEIGITPPLATIAFEYNGVSYQISVWCLFSYPLRPLQMALPCSQGSMVYVIHQGR